MRSLLSVVFLCLVVCNSYAGKVELFPMGKLRLDMSVDELRTAYPSFKTIFAKKNDAGNVVEGIALFEVEENEFWDSVMVEIDDAKVKSWSYVKTKEFDQSKKNVPRIFKALSQQLGKAWKRKVAKQLIKHGTVKAPLFLWNLDGHLVAFAHTPFKEHEKGELFICRLTISPNDKSVAKLFEIVASDGEKDTELFEDVFGENSKGGK